MKRKKKRKLPPSEYQLSNDKKHRDHFRRWMKEPIPSKESPKNLSRSLEITEQFNSNG